MDDRHYDGTPVQAGLETAATQHTHVDPQYNIQGLREMVVIERKFVDERGNRSRSYVEYTCRDLFTGDVIPNVRRMAMAGGYEDGDDFVLQPATKLLPGATTQRFTRQTRARDTDGDRVLVGFIDGVRTRAVILGVLTHTSSSYGATLADGSRRLTVHKGTHVELRKDGTYVVSRNGSSITVNADDTVEVKHKSGATLTMTDAGDIVVEPAAGRQVMLGSDTLAAPLDGVVHGSGIDSFTGAPYASLGNASVVVLAKKT